jgi:hypothetical protein
MTQESSLLQKRFPGLTRKIPTLTDCSGEATFHVYGTVNRYPVRGREIPHDVTKHEWDSRKMNVW